MKSLRLRYLFLAAGLSYFSLHIALETAPERFHLQEIAWHSANGTVSHDQIVTDQVAVVFHLPTADGSQAQVRKYRRDGSLLATITLPPQKVLTPAGDSLAILRKPGFLTHPDDGSYFIWFPQLGSQVYFFDENGVFLWEKRESRYLQTSPGGKYVLAAAGDHSRLMVLNPSLQRLADFEGLIFTHYRLSDDETAAWQFCASFIDGEIVAANLEKKEQYRLSLPWPVKALECDFTSGYFWAQVEVSEGGSRQERLIQARLPDSPAQQEARELTVLYQGKRSYPLSWPLAASPGGEIALVLPAEDNRHAEKIVVIHHNRQHTLNFPNTVVAMADIRMVADKTGFVMTYESAMVTFDRYGVTGLYPRSKVHDLRSVKGRYYLLAEGSMSVFRSADEP